MSHDNIKLKLDRNEYSLKSKHGKSDIWIRFKEVYNEEDEKIPGVIACENCHKVFTFHSHKTGTSSFLKHKCGSSSRQSDGRTIKSFFKKKENVELIKLSQNERKLITEKCTKFVCRDLRPFNLIKGEGFQELAQSLISIGSKFGNVDAKDLLPDPTTVSRNIDQLATTVKQSVIKELENNISRWGGAVTLDMWTDDFKKNSYLCMTIHYITENWTLMDRVLHTNLWDSDMKKSGENIKSAIVQNLDAFGIGKEFETLVYVTDRGSNMIAALKNNNRISCIAHILNNVLEKTIDNSSYFSDLINASKSLVKYFKQSGLQNRLSKTLKAHVDTRWNSLHTMCSSIQEVYSEIKTLLSERKEESRLVDIREQSLSKLVSFLKMFKDASDEMEATKRPTLFIVIVWYKRLLNHFTITDEDDEGFRNLKTLASDILKDKIEISKYHKMALFLHPKMKSLKLLGDFAEIKSVHEDIRKLLFVFESNIKKNMEISSTVEKTKPASCTKKQKLSSDISYFEDTDESDDEVHELDHYITMKSIKFEESEGEQNHILKWWQTNESKFPSLSKVAKFILSIPASSAASERDFSSAGLTLSNRRTNMSPETLNNILFLHSNLNAS